MGIQERGILIAVRAEAGVYRSTTWRKRFTEDVSRQLSPTWLGVDGALIEFDGSKAGTYDFVECADARRSFGSAPWFDLATKCPFLGAVVGFVHVDLFDRDDDLPEWLLSQLLYASRGFLVRLDDGRRFEATVEEDFTLENVVWKHGFHDGECFYERADHADYVREVILSRLQALGLPAQLITFGTGHNPHRVEDFLPGPHGSPSEAWRVFEQHKQDLLRLWVFNAAGACEPEFAELVRP